MLLDACIMKVGQTVDPVAYFRTTVVEPEEGPGGQLHVDVEACRRMVDLTAWAKQMPDGKEMVRKSSKYWTRQRRRRIIHPGARKRSRPPMYRRA
jgi:hypothetical protein